LSSAGAFVVLAAVVAGVFAVGRATVAARRGWATVPGRPALPAPPIAPAAAPGRVVFAGTAPEPAAFGATKSVFGTTAARADWVAD